MNKSLYFVGPKAVKIREEKEEPVGNGQVRVKTLFSGISHGTEMNVYRGTAVQINKRRDEETGLFVETAASDLRYPFKYGYQNVGKIIECGTGASTLKKGDVVYSYYSHRESFVANENELFKIPENLDPELGVFIANINTSYNAVLDAQINLGENVVVFGLGVIGQVTAQLCKVSGVRNVVGIDLFEKRLQVAKSAGINHLINISKCGDAALEIRNLIGQKKGADIVIECSGNDRALNEAIRSVRYNGKIVVLSWYQKPWVNVQAGAEFHLNRPLIIGSQVGGINPELSARWDSHRRMETVINYLLPILKLKKLITARVPFAEAGKAYEKIDQNPSDEIQVVLKYD